MVIATVMCVLLALLIPATVKGVAKQKRIGCVSRLKDMGLGYRIFATDNHELFPWQITSNTAPAKSFDDALRHYLAISNELAIPKILVCPADTRKAAPDWKSLSRTNISYFINFDSADANPQFFLVGDRNITTNGVRIGPGIVNMSGQTNIAWDGTIHRFQGNAAMGDGSVQQLSAARMKDQLKNSGQTSITWAVP